jgi:hypothetical protein
MCHEFHSNVSVLGSIESLKMVVLTGSKKQRWKIALEDPDNFIS